MNWQTPREGSWLLQAGDYDLRIEKTPTGYWWRVYHLCQPIVTDRKPHTDTLEEAQKECAQYSGVIKTKES